jgi:hypothetical protein
VFVFLFFRRFSLAVSDVMHFIYVPVLSL